MIKRPRKGKLPYYNRHFIIYYDKILTLIRLSLHVLEFAIRIRTCNNMLSRRSFGTFPVVHLRADSQHPTHARCVMVSWNPCLAVKPTTSREV
jgi:hypothetical protein